VAIGVSSQFVIPVSSRPSMNHEQADQLDRNCPPDAGKREARSRLKGESGQAIGTLERNR
jgi:hypothetical protein